MKDQPLILLVDDDDSFLEIAAIALERKNMKTVRARGAEEGLRKAEELQPDFALSDILMPPGPTGLEFAIALKKNSRTAHIKMAFFTSLGDPWRDLAEDDRDALLRELGEVKVFDKCADVAALGERVLALINAV